MKNDGSLLHCRAVVQAILRYFVKHPDAKDTTDGIRKWWLPEQYRERQQEELEQALGFLASKNWLTVRPTSEQKTIYGLNKNFLEQITNYLNDADVDE